MIRSQVGQVERGRRAEQVERGGRVERARRAERVGRARQAGHPAFAYTGQRAVSPSIQIFGPILTSPFPEEKVHGSGRAAAVAWAENAKIATTIDLKNCMVEKRCRAAVIS